MSWSGQVKQRGGDQVWHVALRWWFVFLLLSAVSAPARANREACIQAHEEAQLMILRGRYTSAREQLLVCGQTGCPLLIRNDCITRLSEVDASLPSVVFVVSDRAGQDLVDVTVWANDRQLTQRLDGRAVTLDPGIYTLRFEAPGFAAEQLTVTLRETEKQRLVRVQLTSAPLSAPPAPEPAPPATSQRKQLLASYVLGGGGVLWLGTGITLGALGAKERDRLEGVCAERACTDQDVAHGKRLYIAANVSFGVGAALVLAATTLFLVARARGRDRGANSASSSLRPGVGRYGAELRWRVHF